MESGVFATFESQEVPKLQRRALPNLPSLHLLIVQNHHFLDVSCAGPLSELVSRRARLLYLSINLAP